MMFSNVDERLSRQRVGDTALNKNDSDQKRWIRIPSVGHEPNTGLKRGFIYRLIKDGKVKSACIKQPGKLTGCRLVWLPSLLAYIERHVESK